MNYNDLKQIAETKKIEVREIASQLEMTPNGFRESIKNETIQLKRLRQLCEILEIDPNIFFEGFLKHRNSDNSKLLIEGKEKEIDYLKSRINDKDELIRMLREKIDMINNNSMVAASPKPGYNKK